MIAPVNTHAGRLLVASPALSDSNFERAVVFLVRHGEDGAFGLVLNRPVDAILAGESLPQWEPYFSEPQVVFNGGPVQPAFAFGLARFAPGGTASAEDIAPGLRLVDLHHPPSFDELRPSELRVFSGYSGWSPGQLEDEIEQSAWFVVDVRDSDLFTNDPRALWRDVLKRQRGELALFAYFPRDRTAN